MTTDPRPTLPLHAHLPTAKPLVYGCMGIGGDWESRTLGADAQAAAFAALDAAIEAGIEMFDHADIYTLGKSEIAFGRWLAQSDVERGRLIVQSKGGIEFGGPSNRYNFSRATIEACVGGSLERLGTDYLDLWLLHRPDPLMDVDEIATTFAALHREGTVRFFGVSNMPAAQLARLRDAVDVPLIVNQLEMSLARLDWLDDGVAFNTGRPDSGVGATVAWCQRHGVQLQAWGPLAQGRFCVRDGEGGAGDTVQALAERYQVSPEAIVLAFVLRHPAGIQAVIGSARPARIAACAEASRVALSRDDWYALYVAARGAPLP